MTLPSFGPDFRGALDLDYSLSSYGTAEDYLSLIDCQVRQLSTRKGLYLPAPNWGIDLLEYVGTSTPTQVIENAIVLELLSDERALSVSAEVTKGTDPDDLTIVVKTDTEGGPFEFVLSASAAVGVVRIG